MIRRDDLGNGLVLYQDPEAFCFGTDAVLLASFAAEKKFSTAVDLGSGNGIIPVLLAAGHPKARVWGVEIQPDAAGLFCRSVNENHMEDRVTVLQGDLRDETLLSGSYDLVTANPPYFTRDSGKIAAGGRGVARSETETETEAFLVAASRLLQTGGRFCMIHRTERMAALFCRMSALRLEPKRLRLVYSKADREPALFLVEARKDGAVGLSVEKPFFLYGKNGMTADFLRIYQDFGMKEDVHG